MKKEKLQIEMFWHCKKCLNEVKKLNQSPQEYQQISVGITKKGIQVWCNRHNHNVIHLDLNPNLKEMPKPKYDIGKITTR